MARGQTTFHFTLDKHVRPNGEQAVYLRVTQDKKTVWFHSSVYVKAQNFNKDSRNYKWIRQKDMDNAVKNNALKEMKDRIEKIYFSASKDAPVSLSKLKALCNSDSDASLLDTIQQYIERRKMLRELGTSKTYANLLARLNDYCRSRRLSDIMFSDIDEDFITDFDLYLHTADNLHSKDKKKLKQSTINLIEGRLRSVIADAPDGMVNGDPFRSVQRKRATSSVKEILTGEEIKLLESVSLNTELQDDTRNAFLFSYYCSGMRGGDVIQLRWGNLVDDSRLVYWMQKTKKIRNIVLTDQARGIIDKYRREKPLPHYFIFPFLDDNAPWAKKWQGSDLEHLSDEMSEGKRRAVNAKLATLDYAIKVVAKKAGVNKHISMHCARHSFAQRMLDNGVDPAVIKSALGHSSLRMTENYLRDLGDSRVNDEVRKVFDKDKDLRDLRNALVRLPKDKLATLLSEIEKTQQE